MTTQRDSSEPAIPPMQACVVDPEILRIWTAPKMPERVSQESLRAWLASRPKTPSRYVIVIGKTIYVRARPSGEILMKTRVRSPITARNLARLGVVPPKVIYRVKPPPYLTKIDTACPKAL